MTRRLFLKGLLGLFLSVGFQQAASWAVTRKDKSKVVKIDKSEQEWKALLTPEAFHVLREEGTERPGSSPLLENKAEGIYVCAGCELPLFTSAMKYESGTGWPSFYTAIEGQTETKTDFKLIWPRTEYHCARCEGHQGHRFDDGPPPTGERWCNNGVALKFVPRGEGPAVE